MMPGHSNKTTSNPRKLLVLIAGCAGHGKNTLGDFLQEIFEPWCSVRQDAFAYTLKSFAYQSMGTPWHILNGDKDVKESTNLEVAGEDTGITVRKGLQDIGEWFRNAFDERIWANSVRLRAQNSPERVTIVTDCRHPREEIFWMTEVCRSFAKVFVVRIRNSRVPVKRGHPSEDRIADEPDTSFDFLIENEESIEALRLMARELASAIVILDKTGKKRLKRDGEGWAVIGHDGSSPFEPQLTEEDANALARSLDDEPYRVICSTFGALQGQAIG